MYRTKAKTQKEAVEAISSLSDRQFSIVAEIAPLFGTQFPTTNIFGSALRRQSAFWRWPVALGS
jgi:hypothetical protein